MADGFDLLNASIAGPALIKQWGIDHASLGPYSARVWPASSLGAVLRLFGRPVRPAPCHYCSLFFIGVTTLACAWATDLQQLLWLRFLSGLGLGGVLPNVIA